MSNDYRNHSEIKSLGIVNNNPGNVRPLSSGLGTWQGQTGTNAGFAVFQDMSWGIRAWLSNFYSSINKHNTDTISKYITRYAPPIVDGKVENDTTHYIATMVDTTGIPADAKIPLDKDSITKIMLAQFAVELGKDKLKYITQEDIDGGFALLDSKLKSFFNATAVLIYSYPAATFGAASLLLVSAGLITMGAVRIMRRRKK